MGKAGLNLNRYRKKYRPPRTLELLAFDENCRFDTSALFGGIERALVYPPKHSRSIKSGLFIESSEFQCTLFPRSQEHSTSHTLT
jgi:hypothetical protein